MIKQITAFLFALSLWTLTFSAKADVLILTHGYLGSATSWEYSGVVPILVANGWQRAGILQTGPGGVQELPAPGQTAKNKIYLIELPSAAPLGVQADYLAPMISMLTTRHPKERFILVGHSVGGVVLRLAMVRRQIPTPLALITLASPHLGTPRAEQALDATNDVWPIEIVKEFFGGDSYQTLKFSRGLYLDIVRQYPGSRLFWLNNQPHPDTRYFSLVRSTPFVMGDILVPGPSQDMNNIPALRGRAKTHIVAGGHELAYPDGFILNSLLKDLSK
ncbi:MAG: hypothetical protein HQL94_10825 [Magnetococcales bacterium]|nr:hypothetical protein [Magnetococcales bacterium]